MTEKTPFVKNTGKVTPELLAKLIECQKELVHAPKTGDNPFFNSSFVPYEILRDHVESVYSKHDIYIHQVSHPSEKGVGIETIFVGHDGAISNGIVEMPAPKNDPHGYGSAQTYAKRYSLALACGIGGAKDDDGNLQQTSKKALDAIMDDPIEALQEIGNPDLQFDVVSGGKVITTLKKKGFITYMEQYAKDPNNKNHRKMYDENRDQIMGLPELSQLAAKHNKKEWEEVTSGA